MRFFSPCNVSAWIQKAQKSKYRCDGRTIEGQDRVMKDVSYRNDLLLLTTIINIALIPTDWFTFLFISFSCSYVCILSVCLVSMGPLDFIILFACYIFILLFYYIVLSYYYIILLFVQNYPVGTYLVRTRSQGGEQLGTKKNYFTCIYFVL